MNTIQRHWDAYLAMVVPVDAPPVQIQETRRAFYAGAEAMMCINRAIGEPGIAENDAVKMMEGCATELRSFSDDVANGKA